MSFRMKYAGYFALPLLAGLLAGAWLLVRTSGVESVKAAAPTNTAPDVNIEQQYVVLTDKQAESRGVGGEVLAYVW